MTTFSPSVGLLEVLLEEVLDAGGEVWCGGDILFVGLRSLIIIVAGAADITDDGVIDEDEDIDGAEVCGDDKGWGGGDVDAVDDWGDGGVFEGVQRSSVAIVISGFLSGIWPQNIYTTLFGDLISTKHRQSLFLSSTQTM